MPRAVRASLLALGLAAAVYGTASLTGGWLGAPPWWWTEYVVDPTAPVFLSPGSDFGFPPPADPAELLEDPGVARPGREWISGGVVAAGVALAGFGAWPRRRRPTATT
jgi:hypothetical protein